MTISKLRYEIQNQFIELMEARGYRYEKICFDHSEEDYIIVFYCCKYLFRIHYTKKNESGEFEYKTKKWSTIKTQLLNSVDLSELCNYHPKGKSECALDKNDKYECKDENNDNDDNDDNDDYDVVNYYGYCSNASSDSSESYKSYESCESFEKDDQYYNYECECDVCTKYKQRKIQ